MPIDASIYDRLIQPLQKPDSPLAIMQGVANLRDTQALSQQRQNIAQDRARQMQEDAQIRGVLQANNGDVEAAAPAIRQINPDKVDLYLKAHYDTLKLSNDLQNAEFQKRARANDFGAQQLAGIASLPPDQQQHAYDVARASIQASRQLLHLPPATDQELDPVYDPLKVKGYMATSAAQQKILGMQSEAELKPFTVNGKQVIARVTKDGHAYVGGQDVTDQLEPADKQGAEKGGQHVEGMYQGKRTFGVFDPNTNTYNVDGKTVSAKDFTPIPPASLVIHNQTAATSVPGDIEALAKSAGMNVDALKRSAGIYHETRDITGFGMAGKTQKLAIMNAEAMLYPDSNIAASGAQFKADQSSLKNSQAILDSIQAFHPAAIANLKQFDTLFQKIPDIGSPFFNSPVRSLDRSLFGADNVLAAQTAVAVATREIARITSNPKLTGQLSDSARQEVENFLPKDATLKEARDVMAVLKNDLDNVEKGQRDQLKKIQFRLQNPGKEAPEEQPKPTGAPEQKPIPGVPGGVAELRNGRWIRVK